VEALRLFLFLFANFAPLSWLLLQLSESASLRVCESEEAAQHHQGVAVEERVSAKHTSNPAKRRGYASDSSTNHRYIPKMLCLQCLPVGFLALDCELFAALSFCVFSASRASAATREGWQKWPPTRWPRAGRKCMLIREVNIACLLAPSSF